MNVTNESDRLVLDEMKKLFASMDQINQTEIDEESRKKIGNSFSELSRSMNQFESNVIIIVAMGMLKAGKSTLINLLARHEEASPVGFGIDTTLRPALVKMAELGDEKGCIKIYKPINGEERNKTLGRIMDSLRKLPMDKDLPHQVIAFNSENLKKVLCCDIVHSDNLLSEEPLLIVVETPYRADGKILQDGRMLLDMPGLDSANAAISNLTDDYKAVIDECDLMLFVQSSVAPLNKNAAECLSKILKIRSSATAWVVQNVMLAKHWLTDERLQENKDTQGKYAMKTIGVMMNESSTHAKSSFVNLGMAYDSLFESDSHINEKASISSNEGPVEVTRQSLLKESQYGGLEDQLMSDLHDNGTYNRYNHCKEQLKESLRKAKEVLVHQQTYLKEKERELFKVKREWDNLESDIRLQINSYRVTKTCELKIDPRETFMTICHREIMNHPKLQPGKISGSHIDAYLQIAEEKCWEHLCYHLKETPLSHVLCTRDSESLSAVSFCNAEIKKQLDALIELAEVNYPERIAEIPKQDYPTYMISGEGMFLRIPSETVDIRRYAISKVFRRQTSFLGIPTGEGAIENPSGANLWDGELTSMDRHFEEQLSKGLSHAAWDRLQSIIRESIDQGIERLMMQIQERKLVCQKEMDSTSIELKHFGEMSSLFEDVETKFGKLS